VLSSLMFTMFFTAALEVIAMRFSEGEVTMETNFASLKEGWAGDTSRRPSSDPWAPSSPDTANSTQ